MTSIRRSWREHFGHTRTILYEKVQEALSSVLPITAIVLVVSSIRQKGSGQPAALGLNYFREER